MRRPARVKGKCLKAANFHSARSPTNGRRHRASHLCFFLIGRFFASFLLTPYVWRPCVADQREAPPGSLPAACFCPGGDSPPIRPASIRTLIERWALCQLGFVVSETGAAISEAGCIHMRVSMLLSRDHAVTRTRRFAESIPVASTRYLLRGSRLAVPQRFVHLAAHP